MSQRIKVADVADAQKITLSKVHVVFDDDVKWFSKTFSMKINESLYQFYFKEAFIKNEVEEQLKTNKALFE